MKKLSFILNIIALINLILVILVLFETVANSYLLFAGPYCVFHLIYQAYHKEGIFEKRK